MSSDFPQSTEIVAARPTTDLDRFARPTNVIRFGTVIALAFFVGLLGWAAFAPLDASAPVAGQVVVAGQRQAVQHREGGIVGDLLVQEGQHVRQGQVLIRLASALAVAEQRSLSAQAITLLAQRARLRADQKGSRQIVPPPEFASMQGEDRRDADEALRLQQAQLRSGGSVSATEQGVLAQRTLRASISGGGYREQVAATRTQMRLIDEELEALRGPAEKGFVSKTRLRALERAKADLQGRMGQYRAVAAENDASAQEGRLQSALRTGEHNDRINVELRDVENRLTQVLPRLAAAKDRLERTDIRAPATGKVVGLAVFTKGGVIGSGQKLMDIVPDNASLVIDGKMAPEYADDVRIGQSAIIRFSGIHDRALPIIHGNVTKVGADSLADQRTGKFYYAVEVTVPADQLSTITKSNRATAVKAGLPVNVAIKLRARTALQYILEPLT